MNKKDLIKALSGGLAFGLLVFVFIQIFLFFVDTEFETDEVLKPKIKAEVVVPEVHPLDEEGGQISQRSHSNMKSEYRIHMMMSNYKSSLQ